MDLKLFKDSIKDKLEVYFSPVMASNSHDRDEIINYDLVNGLANVELLIHDDKSLRISDVNVNNLSSFSTQRSGIARLVISLIYNEVGKYGFESFDLQASKVGAYSWAKFGFAPNIEDWQGISNKLSEQLCSKQILPEINNQERDSLTQILASTQPKAIWQLADSPYGRDILIGNRWEGRLDFYDDEAITRFKKYIGLSNNDIQIVAAKIQNFTLLNEAVQLGA